MKTQIGKIKSVRFGRGGYQDAMIGISFDLGSDMEGWGVGDFWGTWSLERSKEASWSEQDRINNLGHMVMRINQLLSDGNVDDIKDLIGLPVEVTFDGNTLKSWRILKEAI